ncbi:response regulator [Sphingomonas sp.]|uniref:response regulator n=1 Tax=Sphingomonas sp. TaxID=28214 RepID=UPI00333EAB89
MARIVIVDDDELLCQIVARTLAPLGHVVVAVRDGDDALEALWENGPDLAILDCALPGKTGLTILREIRQSAMFATLPVLILTARRSEWHAKMAITAGANEYIRKPFEGDELIATIDRLIAAATVSRPRARLLDEARIADLRAVVGGRQADTLLAMMERDIAERTKVIITALAERDTATALKQAHALRGAADGVGALELARQCHRIEREGQTDSAPIAACAIATIDAIAQARVTSRNQATRSSA